MIFKELIKKVKKEEVVSKFLELYPVEEKSEEGYEKVLTYLKNTRQIKYDMTIILERNEEDGVKWVRVLGSNSEHPDWAIEFVSWGKWLGMTVDPKALEEFTETEIVAHCLWEMTYMGFRMNIINKKLKELGKI